jgi:hypothetical protein
MVTKYYVAIRPQTDEHHAVHKEDCPFLPEHEKRIYLGIFGSCDEAIREGQRYFPRTNGCLFCSKEHQHVRKKPELSEIDITGDFPVADQVFHFQKANLLYFLN